MSDNAVRVRGSDPDGIYGSSGDDSSDFPNCSAASSQSSVSYSTTQEDHFILCVEKPARIIQQFTNENYGEQPTRDPPERSHSPAISEGAYIPEDHFLERITHVRGCVRVLDFVEAYNSEFYQMSLTNLLRAVGDRDTEEWAKEWAVRLRSNHPTDVRLNNDRKVCLQLVFTLCDRWKCEHPTVSQLDIIKIFRGERILNILQVALAMDRAHALYCLKYVGCHTCGIHWVSKKHIDNSPMWRAMMVGGKRPSMNKRYNMLLELEGLRLRQARMIDYWLQPRVAPSPDS